MTATTTTTITTKTPMSLTKNITTNIAISSIPTVSLVAADSVLSRMSDGDSECRLLEDDKSIKKCVVFNLTPFNVRCLNRKLSKTFTNKEDADGSSLEELQEPYNIDCFLIVNFSQSFAKHHRK